MEKPRIEYLYIMIIPGASPALRSGLIGNFPPRLISICIVNSATMQVLPNEGEGNWLFSSTSFEFASTKGGNGCHVGLKVQPRC